MHKRGQIFLIAAFVTIGIIIGLATVTNYVVVSEKKAQFFDLSEEIEFETKQVINYGVYNQENTGAEVEKFLREYSDYISEDAVVFVYGNYSEVKALYFQQDKNVGNIDINLGGGSTSNINLTHGVIASSAKVATDYEGKVVVFIEGINYEFALREGQNFFFIIIRGDKGERFVAVPEGAGKRIKVNEESPGINVSFDNTKTPPNGVSVESKNFSVGLLSNSGTNDHYSFVEFDDDLRMWLSFDESIEKDINSGGKQYISPGGGVIVSSSNPKWGKFLDFDGSNDYVGINNFGNFPEKYSISLWVNPDSSNGKMAILANSYRSITTSPTKAATYGWVLLLDSGKLNYASGVGLQSPLVSNYLLLPEGSFNSIPKNQWTHIVLVAKGNNAWEVYINGKKGNSINLVNLFVPSALQRFQIGGSYLEDKRTKTTIPKQEFPFNGKIDEVIFIERALSEAEIKSLYSSKLNRYYNNFKDLVPGSHEVVGYIKDSVGAYAKTETRTISSI